MSPNLGTLQIAEEVDPTATGYQVSPRQSKVTPFSSKGYKDANYRSGDNFVGQKKEYLVP